jgi:hypothetical protein
VAVAIRAPRYRSANLMTSTILAKLPSKLALTVLNDWLYDVHYLSSLDIAYWSHVNRTVPLILFGDPRIRLKLLDIRETFTKKFDNMNL